MTKTIVATVLHIRLVVSYIIIDQGRSVVAYDCITVTYLCNCLYVHILYLHVIYGV